MRKFFLIAVIATSFIVSCKKDNNSGTGTPADPRDRFVGTWNGNYILDVTGIPDGIIPNPLPTSIVITKSQTSATEIEVKINNAVAQSQAAKALTSGNRYVYSPLTLLTTITLNGSGEISSDGKTLTESGTVSGSFPNLLNPSGEPSPVSGTWSSSFTKQ